MGSPDPPSFPYLDDESRIHATSAGMGTPAGNADAKAARLRRVPGFTDSLNDLAPVAGPSPRSFDSIPSTYLDDSHVKSLVNRFRQIIPLSMWYALLSDSDTNYIPIPQPPRFHTPGSPGQNPPAFSQRFVRAEEADLGVSFNSQSQTPDIPCISFRTVFSFSTSSLQDQSKDSDILLLSLQVSTEEFLTSSKPRSIS